MMNKVDGMKLEDYSKDRAQVCVDFVTDSFSMVWYILYDERGRLICREPQRQLQQMLSHVLVPCLVYQHLHNFHRKQGISQKLQTFSRGDSCCYVVTINRCTTY